MDFLLRAGDILRAGTAAAAPPALAPRGNSLPQLLAIIVVFGFIYGAAMGGFGGFASDGSLQIIYSALKVPLLLLATFALSLPSFFVLNTLLGLRDDFREAIAALVTAQGVVTIILSSMAPFTIVWYASSTDYQAAILFNAMMFGIASFAAQAVLRRLYRPLIARDARHRWLLRLWIVIYAFVGIQMGWVLRPFIGARETPARFFREGAWSGNAYVVILDLLVSTLGRWLAD